MPAGRRAVVVSALFESLQGNALMQVCEVSSSTRYSRRRDSGNRAWAILHVSTKLCLDWTSSAQCCCGHRTTSCMALVFVFMFNRCPMQAHNHCLFLWLMIWHRMVFRCFKPLLVVRISHWLPITIIMRSAKRSKHAVNRLPVIPRHLLMKKISHSL